MKNLRVRTAEILEVQRNNDTTSKLVDLFLIILISLNVVAIILESVPRWEALYSEQFYLFEKLSIIIFTVEYLLRIWSSVELDVHSHPNPLISRLKYMTSLSAIIDLLAILPFYLAFVMPIDLRFLRVIRLLRIFKLTRYSGAISILLSVLREESHSLAAAFFVLFVVLILASSGIYLIEHKVQPEAFGSIPDAMWWAMATLTTVGYGDVTPITPWGKFFGSLITLVGMGMVALPAGILASGFSDQLHRRRTEYAERLSTFLHDGIITREEEQELQSLRYRLGLSEEDTLDLLKSVTRAVAKRYDTCPHCHQPLAKPAICEIDDRSIHRPHLNPGQHNL